MKSVEEGIREREKWLSKKVREEVETMEKYRGKEEPA